MDLALNNLQRLICHKTQTTNQPTKQTNKQTNKFPGFDTKPFDDEPPLLEL